MTNYIDVSAAGLIEAAEADRNRTLTEAGLVAALARYTHPSLSNDDARREFFTLVDAVDRRQRLADGGHPHDLCLIGDEDPYSLHDPRAYELAEQRACELVDDALWTLIHGYARRCVACRDTRRPVGRVRAAQPGSDLCPDHTRMGGAA